MGRAGKEPDEPSTMKSRRNDGDVVQVAGPFPGIVGDVHVTLMNVAAPDTPNEVGDSVGHGVYVARGAGNGLCDH